MIADTTSLLGLTLQDPAFLLLLLVLPLAWWLRRHRGAPAVQFGPAPMASAPPLPRSPRQRLAALPTALHVLGLALAILALSRPVHRTPQIQPTEGIDILLCLDTSSSMAATDLDRSRNRLQVVKAAARDFIAGRPEDRIGLLCFARYPDLRCPPTLDHHALAEFLGAVEMVAGDGPEDATGIGTAVARAAQVLRSSTARSRVAILLTDGAENVATAQNPDEIAPLHAAQLCQDLRLRVYTIAAGLGAPAADGQFTALDVSQVQELARRTGGRFFEARDADAVNQVYAAIDQLERSAVAEPRYRIEERFLPFLLAGLALVLIGRLLGATWLGVWP